MNLGDKPDKIDFPICVLDAFGSAGIKRTSPLNKRISLVGSI